MTNNVKNIDFSSRTTYDGSCASDDEIIVPWVYTNEMKNFLKIKGFTNVQVDTHHLPNGKTYRAFYIKIKKNDYGSYKKAFDGEIKRHIEHEDDSKPKFDRDLLEDTGEPMLSLDKIYEDMVTIGERAYDPTGTNKYADCTKEMELLEYLLAKVKDHFSGTNFEELSQEVITLIYEGYKKNEIIEKTVLSSKKKTQAYDDVNKILDFTYDILMGICS